MNKTIKTMLQRKSTRSFADKQISKQDIDLIIEASVAAPTAGAMQLYSIIKVTNKKILHKLSILCDNQPFIEKAQFALIYVADYYKWQNVFKAYNLKPRNIAEGDLLLAIEDSMAAAQNAVIASESLGISSCYIGDIMENYEEVTKLLKLPQHTYPCTMLVFAYPDPKVKKQIKPKRFDNKYVVFDNTYKTLNASQLKQMFKARFEENKGETLTHFMNRKHNSKFSREMQRSGKLHIKYFINNK